MSKLRVHAFTISLDGYGAGPNQDLTESARCRRRRACTNGSSRPARSRSISARTAARPASMTISPRAASRTSARGSSAATCSARSAARGPTTPGRAGGATTRPIASRCSCSPTTRARRSPWTGGTTFHFVTDGIDAALKRAREAANGRDVRVGGGAATIRQYLQARLVDEMHVAISPVLLGSGEALFAGLDLPALGYERTEHVPTAKATHVVITKRG